MFEELVLSVSTPLKKHIWLGHDGIVDIPSIYQHQIKRSIKKGMDRSNKKKLI